MKAFMDKYVYPAEQVIILADNSIKIIPWPHRFFLKFFSVWERMSHVKQQKRVAKVQDNQGVFSSSPHFNLFSLLCSLFTQNDAEKNFKKNLLTRVIKNVSGRGNYIYQQYNFWKHWEKKLVIWNIILLQAFYEHASNPETQWSIPPLMEELKVLTVFFKM